MRSIPILILATLISSWLNAQNAKTGVHFSKLLANGGFEQPLLSGTTISAQNPNIPDWTSSTGAVYVVRNGSQFNNPIAPEGTQAIALQNTCSLTRSFDAPMTDYYRFKIKAAQKPGNNQTFLVMVDDVEMAEIKAFSNTFVEYISVPFKATGGVHSLKLIGTNPLGGDNTVFIDNITLEQPRRWNDPLTWVPSGVPTASSNVIIDPNSFVVMDGTCIAKTIMVHGFLGAVNNMDISLNSEAIMVMGSTGSFEIGQYSTPYTSKMTINLKHTNETDNYSMMGTKVLGAMEGGTIRMHGLEKKSWTQLSATALAGASQITVSDPPTNWSVGDDIVIASSDFDMNKAEQVKINSISGNTITLQAPLQFKHFGITQTYKPANDNSLSWILDERAEVGLLSHNITISGVGADETNGFGGQIMIMGTGKAFVSGVELRNMGQRHEKDPTNPTIIIRNGLGRYPFHWHNVNNATNQYFMNSSIHHTYNRAVTIHNTNNATVTGNVAYNNLGHAYFMEDGTETNNTITNNIGIVTIKPSIANSLLPSDYIAGRNMSGPSTFWITNPNNTVKNNRACGSDGSGIWFAFHNKNGTYGNTTTDPNVQNIIDGTMDDNTAHSSVHGMIVGAGPTTGQGDSPNLVQDYRPILAPFFKNITLYKNILGLYSRISSGANLSKYENLIVADNYKGEVTTWTTNYNKILWVGGSSNNEALPLLEDLIKKNKYQPLDDSYNLASGHIIYDGPVQVTNSYFAGFSESHMSILEQWPADLKFTGQTFQNTTVQTGSYQVKYKNDYANPMNYNAVAYDLDGKLTNKTPIAPMTAIIQDHPFLIDSQSKRIKADFSGMESSYKYGYMEVAIPDDILPASFNTFYESKRRQNIATFRSDGALSYDPGLLLYGASIVPILNGVYTYSVYFTEKLPNKFRMDFYSMNAGDYVIVGFPNIPTTTAKVCFTSAPRIDEVGTPITKINGGIAELKAYTGGTAYCIESNTIYVRYQAPVGSVFTQSTPIGSFLLCADGNCNNNACTIIPDDDGDGYNCVEEQVFKRNPYSAKDFAFIFDTSKEGWNYDCNSTLNCYTNDPSAIPISTFNEYGGKYMHDFWYQYYLNSTIGTNPFIERNGFKFLGDEVPSIQALVRSEKSGTFELYWKTEDDQNYNETKKLSVNYTSKYTSNPFIHSNIIFDLKNHAQWKGKRITGLQLHAPNATGLTGINSIRSRSNFLYAINSQGNSGTLLTTIEGAGLYKYKPIAQSNLITPLPTNTTWAYDALDWDGDGITEVSGINYLNTSNGKVQITLASGKSNYSSMLPIINNTTSTILWSVGQKEHYKIGDVNADGKADLWFISHRGVTGSGKTEVHVADGSTNFQTLNKQMATSLGYVTNDNDDFVVADYDGDKKADLWYIKSDAIANKTVIQIFLNANDFKQTPIVDIVTTLPANTGNWSYTTTDFNGDGKFDLVAVNKQGATGSVEVTVLDGNKLTGNRLYFQISKLGNVASNWVFVSDRNPTFMGTNLREEQPEAIAKETMTNAESDFSFYPNPTNSVLYVSVNNPISQIQKIRILNNMGSEMRDYQLVENKTLHSINLESLPSGQYFVSVQIDDKVKNKIFIISR